MVTAQRRRWRRLALAGALGALAAFCVVQDRTMAAGVGDYVNRYHAAAAVGVQPASMPDVLAPWAARSVRRGTWAAAPLVCAAVLCWWRSRNA